MATKHNHQVCFGRRVEGCPRCAELTAGAAPRDGWQRSYYARQAAEAEAFRRGLAAALREAERTGTVCTYGEW